MCGVGGGGREEYLNDSIVAQSILDGSLSFELVSLYELHHEKTRFLPVRKQRRRPTWR